VWREIRLGRVVNTIVPFNKFSFARLAVIVGSNVPPRRVYGGKFDRPNEISRVYVISGVPLIRKMKSSEKRQIEQRTIAPRVIEFNVPNTKG